MVKDHSGSERENPLPPHGLLFPISSKGYFICNIPQTGQHIPRTLLHQSWRLDNTIHIFSVKLYFSIIAQQRYFRICFCTFDLSCSILEKENFIENLYIVLSCLIK